MTGQSSSTSFLSSLVFIRTVVPEPVPVPVPGGGGFVVLPPGILSIDDHLISSRPMDSSAIFKIPRGGTKSQNDNENDNDNDNDNTHGDSTTSPSTSDNPIVQEILEAADDYYRVLGLSQASSHRGRHNDTTSITATQIQKAYRRRAVQTHPDKTGGDRRAFDVVAKAFEVLSDEQRRAIYDRYGVAGLEQQQQSQSHPHRSTSFSDLFQSMFHTQQEQFVRRNRTVRYQLQVGLEDLYRGVSREIWVSAPLGMSSTAGSRGKGKSKGKTVQVEIPRGAVPGQPIVVSGAMDFQNSSNTPPGDLIFVVTPAPHPVFTRKNHDLAMELVITLEEAICGLQGRKFQHLDGTTLEIQSATAAAHQDEDAPPLVIATGDVQVLKGRGFPKSAHGEEYGDLYIQFRVEMPKSSSSSSSSSSSGQHPLSHEERNQLRRLLEKLQGKRTKKTKKQRHKSKSKEMGDDASLNEQEPTTESSVESGGGESSQIHRLVPGKVSDFGRATGTARWHMDDEDHHDLHHHHYGDDDDDNGSGMFGHAFSPFGGMGSSSSFFAGQSGEDGHTRRFYFGNHPFLGEDNEPGADQPHTECQTM